MLAFIGKLNIKNESDLPKFFRFDDQVRTVEKFQMS